MNYSIQAIIFNIFFYLYLSFNILLTMNYFCSTAMRKIQLLYLLRMLNTTRNSYDFMWDCCKLSLFLQ